MIDHQHAVEVIGLVLDGDSEQPLGGELDLFSLFVGGNDGDLLRSLDFLVDTGKGKTTFLPEELAFASLDLGVDENPELTRIIFGGCVDDEEADGNTEFGSSREAARGGLRRCIPRFG